MTNIVFETVGYKEIVIEKGRYDKIKRIEEKEIIIDNIPCVLVHEIGFFLSSIKDVNKYKEDKFKAGKYKTEVEVYYLKTNKENMFKYHNIDNKPSIVWYYRSGQIKEQYWFHFGKNHRIENPEGLPASIYYRGDGSKLSDIYRDTNGCRHRLGGPAVIYYHKNKNTKTNNYVINGDYMSKKEFIVHPEVTNHIMNNLINQKLYE
jgi:hypothetical protein